jgi:aspartokinase/homoserine dehydrogenase 1
LSHLLLMKFGGTSMGSAERMRVAGGIVADSARQRPVAIVVSAMSKVTDTLLETLRHAEGGDSAGVRANLEKLETRHVETARELLPEAKAAEAVAGVRALIQEVARIAGGVELLGERPPRSVDEAVAIGERLSALLMAAHLEETGVSASAVNARDVVVTDAMFGNATPLLDATRERAGRVLRPLLDRRAVPVVTGFNGATADGRPTTLGRGGSDFSASILAGALDASELWIWTDVDGIMTADPRLVKEAAVLDAITYREAAELAYNGAKVLHPRTLAPLMDKGIPVWSKNSFNLSAPGTRIVPGIDNPTGPKAVTSMANVALVSIEPHSVEINRTLVIGRSMEALAQANVEVLTFLSSSYQQNFCFLVRKDELPTAIAALENALSLEFAHGYVSQPEIDEEVGLLAVVGEGMKGHPGLAGRIFTAISQEQINIIAIAQGPSELTIGIVVRRDGLERAVQAVHTECGLGNR